MKRFDAFNNMRKQRQARENRDARAKRIAQYADSQQSINSARLDPISWMQARNTLLDTWGPK